jgi:hypothetical protein
MPDADGLAALTDLTGRSSAELEAILKTAPPVPLDRLSGHLFHGMSLAMPAPLFALFGKFGKSFVADPATGELVGWNTRMRQNATAEPWTPLLVRGREVQYGKYRVAPHGAPSGAPYPGALLIDYGRGGNRSWDPLGRVRDFIAAVDGAEGNVWLGRMFLALGGRLVPTPSYFGLARGPAI